MEKTEKRTAEEILRSVGNGVISKSVAIKAMHEYAAQELDAYKARLKEVRSQAIQDCIDTLVDDIKIPVTSSWLEKLEQLKTKP